MELHAAYWRKQFDAFTTQAEEVRNRMFEFGAAKPKAVEPSPRSIPHEPAKKAPIRAQKAPKKRHHPQPGIPPPRREGATHKNSRCHLLGRQFVHLLKDNPGPKKRVLRQTSLRGCEDPRRAFLPRKEGSKSPKRDRHQVWSVRREFVRPMNDNPGRQKRMLRKRRLLSKAFRPQSNLASLMGTQFALRALRLGGWSMAFGARSLQTRFS